LRSLCAVLCRNFSKDEGKPISECGIVVEAVAFSLYRSNEVGIALAFACFCNGEDGTLNAITFFDGTCGNFGDCGSEFEFLSRMNFDSLKCSYTSGERFNLIGKYAIYV
jgi:hypothetical protein